jgi:cytochrome c oxidase assembly protein subunit 11
MDQMRAVYKQRNRTTMNYTLSIILGTVALSYGSVPLYKMVRRGNPSLLKLARP